jgi:hypothetical protein
LSIRIDRLHTGSSPRRNGSKWGASTTQADAAAERAAAEEVVWAIGWLPVAASRDSAGPEERQL